MPRIDFYPETTIHQEYVAFVWAQLWKMAGMTIWLCIMAPNIMQDVQTFGLIVSILRLLVLLIITTRGAPGIGKCFFKIKCSKQLSHLGLKSRPLFCSFYHSILLSFWFYNHLARNQYIIIKSLSYLCHKSESKIVYPSF